MARPGTEVEELPDPVIGFGKDKEREKYGGFAYSLDFNLSLIEPTRVSVSFISEDRRYDFTELEDDIADTGVRKDPTLITYCEEKKFYGYPLKYSVNRSPRGDILTVDFYDASITELDNTFVLLNNEDIPVVNPAIDDSLCLNYENIKENPCPERIFNLGSPYLKKGTGFPNSNPACIPPEGMETEVLYSNLELAELIKKYIPVDVESLKALTTHQGDEGEVETTEFLEGFHGTLRDVLKNWGERMGFTFYWDSERGDDTEFGQLVLINLTDGLFYSNLKETVELILGTVNGGACNLLDSTEALSMEQTFNKAISANYTNSSMGQSTGVDNLMLLDLFTLPIRGCVTDKGLAFSPNKYDGPIKELPTLGFLDGSPQYRWWKKDLEWYKEWDNPEYHPKGDKPERKWLEYEPKRPAWGDHGNCDSPESREFLDYVRLVKAAALGQEFFKAYVFFKSMQNDEDVTPPRTLLDFAQENFRVPADGGGVEALSCKDALRELANMGCSLNVGGAGADRPPGTADYGPEDIAQLIEDGTVCGSDEDNCEEGGDRATWERMKGWTVVYPQGLVDDESIDSIGTVSGGSNKIIPNLVQNIALKKILSSDAEGANPEVLTPNIKICRGTVLGKNCLTVKVLDPISKAVQFLYREGGNQWGGVAQ